MARRSVAAPGSGACSSGCDNPAGALDYLKFSLQDKYFAAVSEATGTIPATDAAAAQVDGYEPGGINDVFRQYSKNFAEVRPQTPAYPFIATTFTKAAQDILYGADPQAALDQAVADIDANQKSNNNSSNTLPNGRPCGARGDRAPHGPQGRPGDSHDANRNAGTARPRIRRQPRQQPPPAGPMAVRPPGWSPRPPC